MTEIHTGSRITLHPLRGRPDRDEWIVGRLDTGVFVALPPVGERAVALLADGLTVGETADRLAAETGTAVDTVAFARELLGLGFVRDVDGRPIPGPEAPPPTLPRLRPRHLRWALHPAAPLPVAALVLAAAAVCLRHPDRFPGYRSLLWSPHGSLVLLTGAAAGWALVLLHECAHLVCARAAGVPARIRLGTRLQFLVVQTDISGIELAPRRHRLTAYLAGIGVNLAVASAALLVTAGTGPGGAVHRTAAALVLLALLPLPFQCLVFLRTDLYFVLQDLTGCRNLHGDGAAYLRHLLRPGSPDPSAALPARERRAVRIHSAVLAVGTVLCLAAFAGITAPADLALLARAAHRLGPDEPLLTNLDSAAVLLVVGGAQLLWCVTRWRRRRRRNG